MRKEMADNKRKKASGGSQLELEAVVFDAYGTLFGLSTLAIEFDRIHRGKGKQLLEFVRRKQLEYAWSRSLINKFSSFDSITRNSIMFALKEMNLDDAEADVEKLYSSFLRLKLYDDVQRALTDLDDQLSVRLAILSNGTDEMLNKLIENTGLSLLSEEIISVEGARRYKPDPRAYEYGLNELNIFAKDRVLYVSGNTWDVAGAKAFGLKVGWINRTGQSSFDEEFRDLRPNYEFSNLEQLTEMLTQMPGLHTAKLPI
jgi:2-haloacid dehalogenase